MRDEVLLVEDDLEAGRLVAQALAAREFDVHRVAGAGDGLAVLASRDVACVVLALGSSVDEGLETVRHVRMRHPTIPVVVVAASVPVDVAVRAMKYGAADVVEWRAERGGIVAVKAHDAVAEATASGRRSRIVRPAFVGRETECRFLESELGRAIAGQGRVVLIAGEDGIGKTSLPFELTHRARGRGALVLWGPIPESRRQAISDRLARVSAPCRQTLEAAAVVGPEVPPRRTPFSVITCGVTSRPGARVPTFRTSPTRSPSSFDATRPGSLCHRLVTPEG